MQGKPDYSGLCNVGECMAEDLRRAGDYAFAGGMSNLVEAVRNQAARLATYEAALRSSKTALEECANLLRDRYPSVANNIVPAHIAEIDKALEAK